MVSMKKQYIIFKILALSIIAGGCTIDLEDLDSDRFKHENHLLVSLQENLYKVDFTQYSESDIIPFFMISNPDDWALVVDSSRMVVQYKGTFDYGQNNVSPFQINASNQERVIHDVLSPILDNGGLLESPIAIIRSNFFIYKKYSIDAAFNSRVLPNQLKLIAQGSDEVDEIDIFDLIDEIIQLLYLETLRSVEIGFNHEQTYLGSIDAWSDDVAPDSLIMDPKDDLSMIEFAINNLSLIIDAAEQNLVSKIDPQYVSDVQAMWIEKKTDLYLSLILLFNDFKVAALMPGNVSAHNASESYGDTLVWNFSLPNFAEKDYIINASSRIVYKNRVIGCLVIAALIILGVIRKKYKL
jgi:hypothetical protein